jgi:hypothetical protein
MTIEKMGKMISHVVYMVKGFDKNGPFDIKRRYSDFFELRKKLLENWPGIFIPAVPEKKFGVNLSWVGWPKIFLIGKQGQRVCCQAVQGPGSLFERMPEEAVPGLCGRIPDFPTEHQ